ncbi:hypothetical protein [Roseiflexus sp.]
MFIFSWVRGYLARVQQRASRRGTAPPCPDWATPAVFIADGR